MQRVAFIVGVAAAFAVPGIRVEAQQPLDATLTAADMQQIVQRVRQTQILRIWKPASAFPVWSPLALPKRLTPEDGTTATVWINVDHRELMTPRTSHPEDDAPVIAAVIAGTLDLNLPDQGWRHLAAVLDLVPPPQRYGIVAELGKLVVSRYNVHTAPSVSDAEFAREAFPFEVIRNMTPGVPGVDAEEVPAGTAMPKDAPLIAYVGRTDARHPGAPVIWGDTARAPANFQNTPAFLDLYMRAYVLATADMQPAGTPEKRGYDEARAADERSGPGSYAARYAFAAPYLARVRALVSH